MASLERAQMLLFQKRIDLAERELRGVLAEDPDMSLAHSLLALCLLENEKRWIEATEEAEKAVGIDPDEAFTHYALGQVYLRRNRTNEARQAAEEAIRLDPYDADFFGLLSGIEITASRWQASLDAARRGLEVDPENVQCGNLHAIALERLGRGGEAFENALANLQRSPENAMSHAALGWTALNSGDYKRAQLAFREALRLDPHNEMARDGMVNALNSRSFLFRAVHTFYVKLSRFSGKYQFGILLGAWLLMQVLGKMSRVYPSIAPFTTPITLTYVLFVILTWIASPLFNTFLRFHNFGRHLLTRKETWASNFLAMCMIASVLGGIYGFWHSIVHGVFVFGYWVMMMMPISAIFQQSSTRRTIIAVVATVVVGLIPVVAIVNCLIDRSLQPVATILPMFGWGILAIQIGSGIAQSTPIRR